MHSYKEIISSVKRNSSLLIKNLLDIYLHKQYLAGKVPLSLIGNPVRVGSGPAAVIGDERCNTTAQ